MASKAKALLGHANPEIVVEGAVDIGIERAAAIGGGAHEGGRLADEAVAFEHLGIPGEGGVAADESAVLVDPPAFAVHHVDFGVGVQVGGGGTDGAGKKRVVGVEPDEDFAAGL